MKNIFLSYATGSFIHTRDRLCESALHVGFDEARACGPDDLDPKFAKENEAILSQKRGAGYWLWKPKIIIQELKKLEPGDLLVYSDAGRSEYYRFCIYPEQLSKLARAENFLLGPTIGQHGPMKIWTKRDCFVLLGMDTPEAHQMPPIQATWSFWTPSSAAFNFLESWLNACTDPRILTDMENTQGYPNLPGFKDHRHDQAILSLLAYKYKAYFFDQRNTLLQHLLQIRPRSNFSNHFLKRIDDAELIARDRFIRAIFTSFNDLIQ